MVADDEKEKITKKPVCGTLSAMTVCADLAR